MTILQAIFDILERLGVTSDDNPVTERLVGQWLFTARNAIVKDWLVTEYVPSSMLKKYSLEVDGGVIKLPVSVFDLDNDKGIVSVSRPGGKLIEMIDGGFGGIQLQKNSIVGMPKEYWFRLGDTIELEGKFPKDIKLEVVLIPSGYDGFEDDDDFPAPSELYANILEAAEKIGSRKLGRPQDIDNDGKVLTNG